MKVQLNTEVHLNSVTWRVEQVQFDYSNKPIMPVWLFEGEWRYTSYKTSGFSVSRPDVAGFSKNFLNEIIRMAHLHEVGELELHEVVVHTGSMTPCYRNQQGGRLMGYRFALNGRGRHSRVMYEASEFKVDGVMDQACLMVLEDVVQQYLGVNGEEILGRKD